MIDAVRAWLREVAPDRAPAAAGVVFSLYRASPKAVILLLDEQGIPSTVVKVARDAAGEPALVAENDALARIAAAPGDWIRSQAPNPIALGRVTGRMVLAQSFMKGTPMSASYYMPGHTRSRRRVARDFSNAGHWLARLQRETTAGTRSFDDEAVDRLVREPVARYRHEIGWSDGEEELFEDALRHADLLRGTPLPVAASHGDFWIANVLVDRAGVAGAVDWELSTLRALPIDDIYKFPTSYAMYLDRALPRSTRVPGHPGWAEARDRWRPYGGWDNLAGFGYAFFGEGWFPSLVRAWISERFAALGLGPNMHPIFFPVFLARQATTLADPIFRDGYRSAIVGYAAQRRTSWLSRDASSSPSMRSPSRTSRR